MVKEYGMSERLGTVALGHKEELVFLGREIGEQKNYSEKTAEAIDEEIRRLIDEGYQKAVEIITDHRDVLDRLANALIQVETLDGENLERVFRGEPPLVGGTPAETPPPTAASASGRPCSRCHACRRARPAPRASPFRLRAA
jgi:cell division protease FtsH